MMSASREKQLDSAERYRKDIKSTLREVGIGAGHHVLDCCCGFGTYTIPAAELVGNEGLVYAVDEDGARLQQLRREAESRGLRNVNVIRRNVERELPVTDGAVDFVLLYDILWYFRPAQMKTAYLLEEVRRVAKTSAVVSVYPTHVDQDGLERFKLEMRESGFDLLGERSSRLVHDGSLVTGTLLNYRKRVGSLGGGTRSGPGGPREW